MIGSRYPNVIATIALFVALGAGAYAAGLAPNSVKSRHIVDGQVKSGDIRDESVTGFDVDESTLGEVQNAESSQNSATVDGADVCKGVARLEASPGVSDEELLCADGAVGIIASCLCIRG